jgi:hypothetical protein
MSIDFEVSPVPITFPLDRENMRVLAAKNGRNLKWLLDKTVFASRFLDSWTIWIINHSFIKRLIAR